MPFDCHHYWSWQDDDKRYHPYPPLVSATLDDMMSRSRRHNGNRDREPDAASSPKQHALVYYFGDNLYHLDVLTLSQTNVRTKMSRAIRPPISYLTPALSFLMAQLSVVIPRYPIMCDAQHRPRMEDLCQTSPEYARIRGLFLDHFCEAKNMAMHGARILRIDKVYHPKAQLYEAQRRVMQMNSDAIEWKRDRSAPPPPSAAELYLWHGTRKTDYRKVCMEQLDIRCARQGVLGYGVYGSLTPGYSHSSFAHRRDRTPDDDRGAAATVGKSIHVLLLLRCLVGNTLQVDRQDSSLAAQTREWRRPPLLPHSDQYYYDSVSFRIGEQGAQDQNLIVCVYKDTQVYVDSAIHYV